MIQSGYWPVGGRISSWDNAIRCRVCAEKQNGKLRSEEDAEWGKAPGGYPRLEILHKYHVAPPLPLHGAQSNTTQLDDRLT